MKNIQKSICRINYREGYGTGFLCKIQYPDQSNFLPVLVTDNHIIKKSDLSQGKKIFFSLNKKHYSLNINKSRINFISENTFNIVFIEITRDDKIDNTYFLEIDDFLYEKNYKNNLDKKYDLIYLLYYQKNGKMNYSFGKIKSFNKNNNNIEILFSCEKGSLGCPILNSSNKIIGIYHGKDKTNLINTGILIKEPIDYFFKLYKKLDKIRKISEKKNEDFLNLKQHDKSENKNNLNKKGIEIKSYNNLYNPYIRALVISFYKIEKFKVFFKDSNNFLHNKNYFITNLIKKFIDNYELNNLKSLNIIHELEEEINKIGKNNLQNFKMLIDFILTKLHEELNKKQILNNEYTKEENIEKNAFNNFCEFYFKQNESFIQNLFFGIKEIQTDYKCCNLSKYKFNIYKYIYFEEYQIKNKPNNLQDLISGYENFEIPLIVKCSKCSNSKDNSIHKKLIKYPNILIIIINNKNKLKINLEENKIINIKKYEFKLICCIYESKKENYFNILYNSKNNWYIIENDDDKNLKEEEKRIDSLKFYPCVLFYEKENKKKEYNSESTKNYNKINENQNEKIKGENIIIIDDYNKNNKNNENNKNNKNIKDKNNQEGDNKNSNDKKKDNINNNIKKDNNEIKTKITNEKENKKNEDKFINKNDNSKENNYEDIKEISLYFILSNGKELYLDVKNYYKFEKVHQKLYSKYLWLKNINFANYEFNKKNISFNKTVKEIGLKEGSIILIKEK